MTRRILASLGGFAAPDGGVARRLDVLPLIVDAPVDHDRLDHGVAGDGGFGSALDDALQHVAEIFAAAHPKAGGVSVAVDGARTVELEFLGDVGRAAPVKNVVVNGFAMLVAADGAAADVAIEGSRAAAFGSRPRLRCGRDFFWYSSQKKASAKKRKRKMSNQ